MARKNLGWIFYVVCALIVATGLYIRCSTVAVPMLWHDEATSLAHATGNSSGTMLKDITDKEITFGAMKNTYLTAKKDATLPKVWDVLAKDDPHHAPLFPMILNLWERYVSADLATVRWVTIAISLFQVPAMFWLGREISGNNNRVAALATALLAVSPVNLWYAQELREYSLLVLLILVSTAAFIRSMRTDKIQDWLIYFISLSVGFYASAFTVFTMASHGLYLLIMQSPKVGKTYFAFSKRFLLFVGMLVATLIVCLPRFAVQISRASQTMEMSDWLSMKRPFIEMLNHALFNTFLTQFDMYQDLGSGYLNILGLIVILVVTAVVIARSSRRSALLFLGCWAGVSMIVFWLPDFIFGGWRTSTVRYWLPIPISFVLTYSLGLVLMMEAKNIFLKVLAPIMLVFIVLCDVFSCNVLVSTAERIQMQPMSLVRIVRVIKWDGPKLIVTSQAETTFVNTMQIAALSNLVDPNLRLLWLSGDNAVEIKDDYFLVLNPSNKVKAMLSKMGYRLEPVVEVYSTLNYLFSAKRKSASGEVEPG